MDFGLSLMILLGAFWVYNGQKTLSTRKCLEYTQGNTLLSPKKINRVGIYAYIIGLNQRAVGLLTVLLSLIFLFTEKDFTVFFLFVITMMAIFESNKVSLFKFLETRNEDE